ncbi:ubiquitin-related modifier 1-like protein [Babesia caballi]|uniref:Ubiquitin-related modifier 1 homolog n=1 Tax=Babesia caballi TaxID=5871 RepID=A0AAV4LPR0_BABCB|nr:ubiquitin-related modifier 1-like protein [Babesia caballi]
MTGDTSVCEILLEFSGGLDTLTLKQTKQLQLRVLTESITVRQLVAYVRKNAFGAKKDIFAHPPELDISDCREIEVQGDCPGILNMSERSHVKPGVLVLIDDVDWELLGGGDCIVKGKQSISFISSLHGG